MKLKSRGDLMNNLKRPNILFAIADDASHMSAYGHRFVSTPNFDWVAQEGILFQNAFTTNPKCAPSRASVLSGMHTWQMEDACDHFGIFPSKFAVYPDLLEASGYFVGYTGKGWGPGDWEKGGFTRNPAGQMFNSKNLTPPADTCISKKDYAGNFEEFLSKRNEGQPFCFWYGCHEPHRRYMEGEGLRAGKKLEDVEVPAYLPDDDIVKSDLLDYAYETEWFDRHLGLMIEKLRDIGELDNTLIIVTSDNGMAFPRVKGQMYEQDFHLPLAVCWKESAKGGRKVEDLISFADFAPTILEAAGLEKHQQMAGRSFMNIILSDKDGFVDESRDRVLMGRERHDLGREDDTGYPVRCIRTKEFLYIRNLKPERFPSGNPETGYTDVDSSPTKTLILNQHKNGNDYYYNMIFSKRSEEELYNIVNDPECMTNLINKTEYIDLKEQLWNELKEALIETGDPRFCGNADIFETYEYVGYSKHSWKSYLEGNFEKQNY
jgi:N-sulfoglucosamine sulfohydrolase